MAQTPNVGPMASARATGFNAFAVGDKNYGTRGSPNLGPTGASIDGYRERNLQIKARQNAILRRMKAGVKGDSAMANLMSVPGSGGPIGSS